MIKLVVSEGEDKEKQPKKDISCKINVFETKRKKELISEFIKLNLDVDNWDIKAENIINKLLWEHQEA